RKKRTRNKIGAIAVQSLSILFSFGTTVLIGWKVGTQNADNNSIELSTLTNFALIISAFATGINTLDKFFDYKALWIGYNVSIANLKSALAKLDYLASQGIDQLIRHQIDEIFNRYEIVCSNMDKNYQEVRSARDE
ncbi:MAG: SLATT domain-containing protein, partial [Flavitalea sp.]